MTSNVAAGVGNVREILREHFKPEFLNRIDDIITFKALGKEEISKIVDIQLALLRKHLEDRKISLELTAGARESLFQEGYDPSFGARPLKRAIQKLIADPLALKLLSGEIQSGEHIEADVNRNGDFVFRGVASKAS
jgi:ATP-dependent Clp protease ATP-binding subunit ClpB